MVDPTTICIAVGVGAGVAGTTTLSKHAGAGMKSFLTNL